MEIQATEKSSNSGRREKLKKKGFSGDGRGAWSGWMGLSAVDALVGGGTCKNNVTRAATRRRVNSRAGPEISVCDAIFRKGFHRKVDQGEVLLLVCSSAGIEVAGKSCR